MSQSRPSFSSSIPEHLLENSSPQDRWMMENISIMSQKHDWLAQEQSAQSEQLEGLTMVVGEIKEQTTKTNGRVTVLEDEKKKLDRLKSSFGDLEEILELKRTLSKKWVLGALIVCAMVFFGVILPWLWSRGFQDLLPLLKNAFGS